MGTSFASDRQADIAAWLQTTGLIQNCSIKSISIKPTRRLTALVTLDDGSAFFLKKMFDGEFLLDHAGKSAVDERDILIFIQDSENLHPYQKVMPAMRGYFEEERLLITEGLQGYTSLREYYDRQRYFDKEIIQKIAENLAACHMSSKQCKPSQNVFVRYHTAPISTYGHITPVAYTRMPGQDYDKYLQEVQSINGELRKLSASWTQYCLIHGDFKFDNIMVCVQWDHGELENVKFVDWELSGWGDPLWDVGTLVGYSIFQWITSIHIDSKMNLQYWIQHATIPFDSVRSFARYFISHYFMHTDVQEDLQQKLKIVLYAGAFLLQRALAVLEIRGTLTTQAYCCIYIGKTLIARPQLGIRLFAED